MEEKIVERTNFEDIDIIKTAYIPYEPYQEVPKCTDYVSGEKRDIVLRNKMNGQLEHIKYELCGGNPYDSNDKSLGYFWYWGLIEATDYTCYLVFWYDHHRNLERITASFAGRDPTSEEWKEMTKGIRYAAEITTRGAF